MKSAVIAAAVTVLLLAFVSVASAYIPREPKPDLQRICYMGHIGQSSGCVWIPIAQAP